MHRAPLLVSMLAAFAAGQEAPTVEAPQFASSCVRVLASPETDWKLMAACEARLALLPARDVMPLVASHELREMPSSRIGICPGSGSAEADRECPLSWRVHYSLRRVWDHQLKTAPIEELRPILVATSNGKMDDDFALVHLYRHNRRYSLPSEPTDPRDVVFSAAADRVMRDDKRSVEDRCAGASVLWTMGRQKDTVEVLLGMPSNREVILLLAGTATTEPRAVPKAFEFLEGVISKKPDNLYEKFLAADSVGRVLEPSLSDKSRFNPDIRDPKYHRPLEGAVLQQELLPELYWADTVANAVAWWKEHRDEYTPEALERRRIEEARAKAEAEERERAAAAERARNAEVPLGTGQWRRVTIGTVVTFPDERGATIYCANAWRTVRGAKESTEDHVAKHGTKRDISARFEVVHARGDALARVRFVGDSEVTWVASREVLQNAAAER